MSASSFSTISLQNVVTSRRGSRDTPLLTGRRLFTHRHVSFPSPCGASAAFCSAIRLTDFSIPAKKEKVVPTFSRIFPRPFFHFLTKNRPGKKNIPGPVRLYLIFTERYFTGNLPKKPRLPQTYRLPYFEFQKDLRPTKSAGQTQSRGKFCGGSSQRSLRPPTPRIWRTYC